MKYIAVFRSEAFDHSWPSDGAEDPNAKPLGRDVAEHLKAKLAEQNILVESPIQGEGGWVVDGNFQNVPFSLFVHWAPIGTPPADHWVIQPQVRRGLIKSLFSARKPPEEIGSLITILDRALSQDSHINELTWLDDGEFAEVY